MEWITNLIALITGLVGLIGTGVGAFFAIKNFIKALKTKNQAEVWALIMSMADAAMKEAEKSGKNGVEKKEMVIEAIKASCEAAGLDITDFIDAVNLYIDQTIKFVNEIKRK